jgi:serine/threonine protein kinase
MDGFAGTLVDGRYEIVRKLGSGGIGDVYRAKDRKVLSRAVVIKVLKDSSLKKPWIVTKFEHEIEALTKIADSGVVGVIDAGKLPNGNPYLVMEFVEGCDLREFMQRREAANGRVALHEVAEIIKQAGGTLTSAHDAGVIHRDLKPANIMVRRNASDDLQVKVIDFGIAKITNSNAPTTTTGMMAGTVAYMAPEQLEGRKATPASDIYALGIIAYEMVTGIKPFNPETPAMLLELQRAGVKTPPKDLRPGLPAPAQNDILKALSYNPKNRYQRARDFGIALAEALSEDDAAATSDLAGNNAGALATTVPYDLNVGSHSRRGIFTRRRSAGLLLSTILVPALIALAYTWSNWSPAKRTLSYSLNVLRSGAQQEEKSIGREVFKSGDRFQLNVFSRESGYLYVLNEGAETGGGTIFTMIYPTPFKNNGSAKHDTPIIQTSWNTFEGPPDQEEFWIIWSSTPVPQLEEARIAAYDVDEGKLSNAATVRSVREFLMKHSDPNTNIFDDQESQQVEIKATRDPLVKLIQLEHR